MVPRVHVCECVYMTWHLYKQVQMVKQTLCKADTLWSMVQFLWGIFWRENDSNNCVYNLKGKVHSNDCYWEYLEKTVTESSAFWGNIEMFVLQPFTVSGTWKYDFLVHSLSFCIVIRLYAFGDLTLVPFFLLLLARRGTMD